LEQVKKCKYKGIRKHLKRSLLMPFGVRTMAGQRASLVEEIRAGERSISEICRDHGISRPTAYKWLERSALGEPMEDRSRAPLSSPSKTGSAVEAAILRAREQHPRWGGRKLKKHLERKGEAGIPASSTITAILHRNGLVSEKASDAARHYRRFEMPSPNDLWQVDFKGHFAMGDGSRCHPLTVTDDMSRYSLCISAKANERAEGVRDSFLSLFRERGLPKIILCDNGPPWGAGVHPGKTKLEVFLLDYGILPIHGKPLHPQTQGKEERFHRTLKEELLAAVAIRDLFHAQMEFDAFRKKYNEERPHCSLGYAVPADKYRNSDRAMPEMVCEWEYPEGCRVRRVGSGGWVLFDGREFYLSEAFEGKRVAFVEAQRDGFTDVIYRNFRVAVIDMRNGEFESKKITRLEKKL
jgi:transposase InsO family protein